MILEVKDLKKNYPQFQLSNVSFQVKEGTIMGFIGRNGAGKSTTLKCLLNQVHPDSGEIRFFGKTFTENELEIKKQIAFVSGGISFYPKKSLKTITTVTKRFYDNWDETAYEHYLKIFKLDERKKADQLSEGMKVKYLLSIAMSHGAKFLLLDEPTSGLDPVSREELLDIFKYLVNEKDVTILFSTHIITDLEKCADEITYIRDGEILACTDVNTFIEQYSTPEKKLSLEEIMVNLEKEKRLF